MGYLAIKNWGRWQTYRADRGQPPWIKIHRILLRNPEWQSMSDSQKGQLVSIWMLAADRNGEIPDNPTMIQKLCGLDSPPDLQALISFGFIEGDAKVTPTRRQGDANVTTQMQNADAECRVDAEEDTLSGKPSGDGLKLKLKQDAAEVLSFINTTTGRSFKNIKNIMACMKREKCSVDDCCTVVRFKWNEWRGTDMERHVNPTTPFRAAHFAVYLDESGAVAKQAGGHRSPQLPDWKKQMYDDMGIPTGEGTI